MKEFMELCDYLNVKSKSLYDQGIEFIKKAEQLFSRSKPTNIDAKEKAYTALVYGINLMVEAFQKAKRANYKNILRRVITENMEKAKKMKVQIANMKGKKGFNPGLKMSQMPQGP